MPTSTTLSFFLFCLLIWLIRLLMFLPASHVVVLANQWKNPSRLSSYPRTRSNAANIVFNIKPSSAATYSDHFKLFYYKQTLDHFNYRPASYTTFTQRYAVDFRYWGGANTSAPIFTFLGEESPLEDDLDGIGFLDQHAPQFKALIAFIEHRYYGKSIPFGSREEAFKNASSLGYFNSAQALADYAEVILHIKKELSAERSPVIVFGGSYGGMLASWFRLKYPHVVLGALASSAPILYFEDIVPHDGFYAIVSKDFRDVSESCCDTIRSSWSVIDKIASKANGLSHLSKKFKTCSPLKTGLELKEYLDELYVEAAQYNKAPDYNLKKICDAIDGSDQGTDILGWVLAGVVVYMGEQSCYNMKEFDDDIAWNWQTCTDLVVPVSHGEEATMFQFSPFNIDSYSNSCRATFGVDPRPHWVVTEFGGRDIKLVLNKFGSNIIFSNGLRDPCSSGGVLQNISDSVVSISTTEGSHCLDILYASSTDPTWLIKQRASEVEIIKG